MKRARVDETVYKVNVVGLVTQPAMLPPPSAETNALKSSMWHQTGLFQLFVRQRCCSGTPNSVLCTKYTSKTTFIHSGLSRCRLGHNVGLVGGTKAKRELFTTPTFQHFRLLSNIFKRLRRRCLR